MVLMAPGGSEIRMFDKTGFWGQPSPPNQIDVAIKIHLAVCGWVGYCEWLESGPGIVPKTKKNIVFRNLFVCWLSNLF